MRRGYGLASLPEPLAMRAFPFACLVLAALGAGCATFPDVEAAETPAARAAGYPALMPIDELLAKAADERVSPAEVDAVQARAAALRARAADLRRR